MFGGGGASYQRERNKLKYCSRVMEISRAKPTIEMVSVLLKSGVKVVGSRATLVARSETPQTSLSQVFRGQDPRTCKKRMSLHSDLTARLQ